MENKYSEKTLIMEFNDFIDEMSKVNTNVAYMNEILKHKFEYFIRFKNPATEYLMDIISVNGNKVIFNNKNKKNPVTMIFTSVNDGQIYIATNSYCNDKESEDYGEFTKEVVRKPHSHFDRYNSLYIKGYHPVEINDNQEINCSRLVNNAVIDELTDGLPFELCKTHKDTYISLNEEGKLVYCHTPIIKDNRIIKEQTERTLEEVSLEDISEVLNFLYSGNIPNKNFLTQIQQLISNN